MPSVYTTLSLRYLRRRRGRTILIVLSIAAGVSMLVATRALNQAMAQAAVSAANPLAGVADLLVGNGEAPVAKALAAELEKVEGVRAARPRVFENVKLPDLGNRPALLVGLDLLAESKQTSPPGWQVDIDARTERRFRVAAASLWGPPPAIVGKALDADLAGKGEEMRVLGRGRKEAARLRRVGAISASGAAAALGGSVVVLNLPDACRVAGLRPGMVSRIDITLARGADPDTVRRRVAYLLAGRAQARTPEEQDRAVQNVMAGMQVALQMCGIAALVIGLFLVYNALSVNVTERRHEIGMLRSIGASRVQIWRLFAGEAALLGLAGSLLGLPLGLGLAHLGLAPMQDILGEIFGGVEGAAVRLSPELLFAALGAGVVTAVAAALVPACLAARARPAEAVRRIPQAPSWRFRIAQALASGLALALGVGAIALREVLPARFGMYGGLALVVVGTLIATPLLTALLARLLQPVARRFLGIEARLAADNLVRAPGRTGLVIAALAAGVALVVQTAGIILSNRIALRDWVRQYLAAELFVTSGSPVSASGQGEPMDLRLGAEIRAVPGVRTALPLRLCKHYFRDTQILLSIFEARDYYEMDRDRDPPVASVEPYRRLAERPDGTIVSENFSLLHGIDVGDTITLSSPRGPVTLAVVGKIVDYSWNHGCIAINRKLYVDHWDDDRADVFDVYLQPGADSRAVQEAILKQSGAAHGLFVLTRGELQAHIDGMIDRLYAIAIAQQVVVVLVAAMGVVTALLISVLQRKRELGLLRAVGASKQQVVRSVVAEASLMGLIGTAIGLLVGVPLQWYALRVVILEETGYSFPVHVPWVAALAIAAVSLLTARLAGLGPALYAVRQRIPEAVALE
ncbi:MAG: ABC transporter permease [Gemmataceae bacterium]|nr:ABC transporter permease [Gemmataceae bacterium]